MKKIFISTILVLASIPALAQHYHGYHYHGYHYHGYRGGGNLWAPLIIGGVAGAVIARETAPVIVQQPPIIVQQPSVVVQQNCTPWTETMGADGIVTKTRTCYN
jgi:hypothetical protein